MNAAILVLATLSALIAPASAPPAIESEAVVPITTCDPLVAIELDDVAGVCPAAAPSDAPNVFDATLDGLDGLTAQPTAKPPKPLGWCRCGCGIRCSTSADCGGASCDRFITCC